MVENMIITPQPNRKRTKMNMNKKNKTKGHKNNKKRSISKTNKKNKKIWNKKGKKERREQITALARIRLSISSMIRIQIRRIGP